MWVKNYGLLKFHIFTTTFFVFQSFTWLNMKWLKLWHATPDIVWPCMLSKRDDGMPCPTLSHRLCVPTVKMAWHGRRHPTTRAFQWRWCHSKSDVIRLCVLPNGHASMPRPTLFVRVCNQRWWWHSMSISSDFVCFPKGNDGIKRHT